MKREGFTHSREAKTSCNDGKRPGRSNDLRYEGPQTRTDGSSALARLNHHAYVICVSDRIDDIMQYPFEGRQQLLDQVLDSITHGDSVLLVGEPGIGKRTMSLGLARRLRELRRTHIDDPVFSRDVYTLSLGASFWNGAQNEDITDIQDNIRRVFCLVEEAGPEKIVFCIDDIDVLSFVDRLVKETRGDACGTGELARDMTDSTVSTENMLRFLLFSKKVLCLCTCIKGAYLRLQRSDTYYDEKFTKSFRVLHMQEPTFALSKDIVISHRERLELEHNVAIPDETLRAAVVYGKVYITHRALPESALDLLQEACKQASKIANNLETRKDEEEVVDVSENTGRVMVHALVQKDFLDSLIRDWCGVSQAQLDNTFSGTGSILNSLPES